MESDTTLYSSFTVREEVNCFVYESFKVLHMPLVKLIVTYSGLTQWVKLYLTCTKSVHHVHTYCSQSVYSNS